MSETKDILDFAEPLPLSKADFFTEKPTLVEPQAVKPADIPKVKKQGNLISRFFGKIFSFFKTILIILVVTLLIAGAYLFGLESGGINTENSSNSGLITDNSARYIESVAGLMCNQNPVYGHFLQSERWKVESTSGNIILSPNSVEFNHFAEEGNLSTVVREVNIAPAQFNFSAKVDQNYVESPQEGLISTGISFLNADGTYGAYISIDSTETRDYIKTVFVKDGTQVSSNKIILVENMPVRLHVYRDNNSVSLDYSYQSNIIQLDYLEDLGLPQDEPMYLTYYSEILDGTKVAKSQISDMQYYCQGIKIPEYKDVNVCEVSIDDDFDIFKRSKWLIAGDKDSVSFNQGNLQMSNDSDLSVYSLFELPNKYQLDLKLTSFSVNKAAESYFGMELLFKDSFVNIGIVTDNQGKYFIGSSIVSQFDRNQIDGNLEEIEYDNEDIYFRAIKEDQQIRLLYSLDGSDYNTINSVTNNIISSNSLIYLTSSAQDGANILTLVDGIDLSCTF